MRVTTILTMAYELVWLKRDLRWEDHAALAAAAARGPVRCLYVVEPELWRQPDAALQHFGFVRESLLAMHEALCAQGGGVEVYVGEMTQVLSQLWAEAPFTALHAHEETGNDASYARDRAVAQWCRAHGVAWHEYPQFGVVRRLKDRRTWASAWTAHMAAPLAKPLALRFWREGRYPVPNLVAPAFLRHDPPERQLGGRTQGLAVLHRFLNARSVGYRGGISSPLSAPDACSRLSPYLAWGCLSLREVVQATEAHLAALPPTAMRHRAGLQAFMSRLHWHCHFIQKLESEPEIEWRNMHRGYDGLREDEFRADWFEALQQGRTGWPMVDACVAMLRETGWLNFRMRAMLVSVAAYPLWLHWRPVGQWLATQFLDYEPGIHWSQMQMQAGTTGINTTRVYNPVKQAQDHDPHGVFVRRWVPGLRQVPTPLIFEPWRMSPAEQAQYGVRLGETVAMPLVDLAQATRTAKARLHERRGQASVRSGKAAVLARHASERQPRKAARAPRKTAPASTAQLGFDF